MPKKAAQTGLAALLDSAALPEKTVEVCLRGDLVAQVEDAERELRDVRTNAQTMADRGAARVLAERIQALREEMQSSSVVFRLRGLTRQGWTALLTEHPPRPGEQTDKTLGYNTDTFFPALIRACLVEPELNDEQWEQLDAVMSAAQFDDLADAALAASRRKVDIPFSFAASATLSTSGETSK